MVAAGRSTSSVRAASTIASMLRWASARRRRARGVTSAAAITQNLRAHWNLDEPSGFHKSDTMSENASHELDPVADHAVRTAGNPAPLGQPHYGIDAPAFPAGLAAAGVISCLAAARWRTG